MKLHAGLVQQARAWKKLIHAAVVVAVAGSVPAAWSAGNGGAGGGGIQVNNVAAGSASVVRQGSMTTIRTGSRNTIINYKRLSVGSTETLRFDQPTTTSRVLNRIQGPEPTKIDGKVISNGRVYFVNPAGVMFGEGAVINVAALYAAAGSITDANFLAGRNNFTGNKGLVENRGVISASQVHLVGANVANFGQIVTEAGGIVSMTAGKDVYIGESDTPAGEPRIYVKVSGDGATKDGTAITNAGTIDTRGGQIQMGAADLYGAGIYNSGMMKGQRISLNSGKNTNINKGTIDASSETGKGGKITLLGEKIGIDGKVTASGKTGGGEILVGGDLHGSGGLPTSQNVIITTGAELEANAFETGDGGRIIVFSSGFASVGGQITALGAAGGQGGFVETSGLQNLSVAQAPVVGATGTWLIDPNIIAITHGTAGTGSEDGQASDGTINFADGLPPNTFTITDGQLNALSGNIVLEAHQNITLANDVVIALTTANQSITMRAGGNIVLDTTGPGAPSITTRGGTILLSAGDQNATGPVSSGSIDLQSGSALSTTGSGAAGGNIILRAGGISASGTIAAGTGTVAFESNIASHTIGVGTGSGDLDISQAELNTITSAGLVRFGIAGTQTGDITFNGITIPRAIEINNNAGAGAITLTGSPALAAGGAVLFRAGSGNTVVGGDITATGAITFTTTMQLNGNATVQGTSLTFNGSSVSIDAGVFNLSLKSNSMTFAGGTDSIQGTGNLTILPATDASGILLGTAGGAAGTLVLSRTTLAAVKDGFASITIGSPTGTGLVTISSDSSGPPFDPVAFRDPVTIQTPGGTMVVNSPDPTSSPGVYGDGNASVTLRANAITLNASVMTNGNDITLNGAVVLGTPAIVRLKSFGNNAQLLLSAGSAGGNVTVIGSVDDDGTASLFNIQAAGASTKGNIDLQAVIGGTTPVDGVAVFGSDVKLHSDVRTSATGGFAGLVQFTTDTITVAGDLHSTIRIDTDKTGGSANAGAFTASAPVNHQLGSGTVNLIIDTSADGGGNGSAISLNSVGNLHPLAGLSLIAGGTDITVADITVTGTFSSSGAAFSNSNTITAGALTVTHTGAVTIVEDVVSTGAVSLSGTSIAISFGAPVGCTAITFTDTAGVTISDVVTASAGFTNTGTGAFTINTTGRILATGGNISITRSGGGASVTINGPITANNGSVGVTGIGISSGVNGTVTGGAITLAGGTGAISLLAPINGTGAVSISGNGITTSAAATIAGTIISLNASPGNITLGGAVTGSGAFSSTGAGFISNAIITANGATIGHSGAVAINDDISSAGFAVTITGSTLNIASGAPISGSQITLTDTSGITINSQITASTGFTSTGGGAFTLAGTGGITTSNDPVTITHASGLVTLNGPISAGIGTVNVTGLGITTSSTGTIGGGSITLAGGAGNVTLGGAVTGTGLFTASGVNFSNSTGVTSVGATINMTGTVSLNAAFDGGSGAVHITGTAITTTSTFAGGAITLTATSGNVTLGGAVVGTGLFTASGVNFSTSTNLTSVGASITMTGPVSLGGPFNAGSGAVSIAGTGIAATSTLAGGAITLTTTSGNITLDGAVTGTGLFTATGTNFTTSAGFSSVGATLTMTGAVSLGGAFTGGSGVVKIRGTSITAASTLGGGAITLQATSGNVTLNGAVTGTGLFTASGVNFSTATGFTSVGATINMTGTVTLNGPFTGGSGAVSITGTTVHAVNTLGGGAITLTATSGDIMLDGAVTGTGLFTASGINFATATNLTSVGATINMTGTVSLGGPLDAGSGAINITGTSIAATSTINGGAITLTATAGNITLNGAVTGTGPFKASGANFSSAADITSTGGTLTMTGSVVLGGAFNGGSGALAISGTTFSNAGLVSGSSIRIAQTGLVTLNAGLTATGTIQIDAPGIAQNAGIINSAALVLKGTGTFLLSGNNTVGTLAANITGPLTFTNAAALTIGTAGFPPQVSGINTHGGTLVLNVSGALTISNDINTGAGDVTIAAPSITGSASGDISGGAITIGGTLINLAGDITGTTIDINGSVSNVLTGEITGTGAVTLNSAGTLTATGGITGTTVDLTSGGAFSSGPITATSGNITLTYPTVGSIRGTNNAAGDFIAGDVLLSGNASITAGGANGITLGNVTGNSNLTLKADGVTSTIIVGAVGVSTSNRLGNFTTRAANLVQLGGDIFAQNVSFEDNLAGTRSDVPQTATVFHDGSLLINANGTFDMEKNQKLTVHDSVNDVGDLTIRTNNHAITVGDLSALGKIRLDTGNISNRINLLQRDNQRVLLSNGSLSSPDLGMDIVAGFNGPGAISMTGTIQVIGGSSAHRIQFSAPTASEDIASKPGQLGYIAGSNTAVIPLNATVAVNEPRFLSNTTVLDIVAEGISGISPSSTQGTIIPRDVQTLQPERTQSISGALREALREIGIYARDLRTDEIIEYLIGRALYDDVPYKLDPGPTDNQVAANRLPYSPVLPTVNMYKQLFFKQAVDEYGKPITENGKPKLVSQDATIARSFGLAYQAYRTDKVDEATPQGFRAFLESKEKDENPNFATALNYLNQLRDLLNQIRNLGLTNNEYETSRKVLLSKVRPVNITEEDLLAAVFGPSSAAVR